VRVAGAVVTRNSPHKGAACLDIHGGVCELCAMRAAALRRGALGTLCMRDDTGVFVLCFVPLPEQGPGARAGGAALREGRVLAAVRRRHGHVKGGEVAHMQLVDGRIGGRSQARRPRVAGPALGRQLWRCQVHDLPTGACACPLTAGWHRGEGQSLGMLPRCDFIRRTSTVPALVPTTERPPRPRAYTAMTASRHAPEHGHTHEIHNACAAAPRKQARSHAASGSC